MEIIWPHLAWFLNEEKYPYLYRRDAQRREFPNDFHTPYETFAEAAKAAGMDSVEIENFLRSR